MRAYTVVVRGRVGRRSEAILLIKRWGIDPNKLAIKPDESLRTIALYNPVLRFRTNVRVYRQRWPRWCVRTMCTLCMYVCVCVCIMCIRRAPSFSRLPPCAEVGDSEGGPKRGGAREVWGGENKLISLTQPAVTPPQHDINPKPRLSLFKLYESLRRRIRGGNFSLGGSLSVPLASPHSFDLVFPRW